MKKIILLNVFALASVIMLLAMIAHIMGADLSATGNGKAFVAMMGGATGMAVISTGSSFLKLRKKSKAQ